MTERLIEELATIAANHCCSDLETLDRCEVAKELREKFRAALSPAQDGEGVQPLTQSQRDTLGIELLDCFTSKGQRLWVSGNWIEAEVGAFTAAALRHNGFTPFAIQVPKDAPPPSLSPAAPPSRRSAPWSRATG